MQTVMDFLHSSSADLSYHKESIYLQNLLLHSYQQLQDRIFNIIIWFIDS